MGRELEVSVVLTVRNEAEGIAQTLRALASQTLKPSEIIVADGGSTDGTPEIVERLSRELPVPVRLLRLPPSNRSVGRNAAIRAARGEIVAVTDGGCVAEPHWLEELTKPFLSDDPPDVVAGFYRPEVSSIWERAAATALVPTVEEIDPETFLPSSRSLALKKSAWEAVGGYPEWLSHNEDTPFDLALKRAGFKFAFAPKAIVKWRLHTNPLKVFKQFFRYAYGDGEAGIFFRHYLKAGVYGLALASTFLRRLRPLGIAAFGAYLAKQFVHRWRRAKEAEVAALSLVYLLALDLGQCTGYPLGWAKRLLRCLREGRYTSCVERWK